MRSVKYLALAVLAITLAGCPITSEYPLGSREEAFMDNGLIGNWSAIVEKDAEKGSISIFQFNDKEMYLEARGDNDNSCTRSRIYVTVVDNVPIINFQEIKKHRPENEYGFLKYNISKDGILTLWVLQSDRTFDSKSGKDELRKHVRDNIANDKLYEKLADFKRIGSE